MKNPHKVRTLSLTVASLLLLSGMFAPASPQSFGDYERERGRQMLIQVKNEIRKNYYDPTFRGIDLEARCKAAEEKMKQATSNGQVFGIIAQMVIDLNDSHTFFIPPPRSNRTEYGWEMQMIGSQCCVVEVKPGSDAEAKGLKVGDVIHSIDGFAPVRENLWKLQYLYYSLRPQPGMRVVAQSPSGQPRELELMAAIKEGVLVRDLTSYVEIQKLTRAAENRKQLNRPRFHEVGEELIIWKMISFEVPASQIDDAMNKVRKFKTLILDLRDNPGGYEEALLRLAAHFFDHDLKLGEMKRRKETKPLMVKSLKDRAFKGRIIVLVDSNSTSAAEALARVVQLEKRGIIIGDRTTGKVMRSIYYPLQTGIDRAVLFGVSITDADLIMSDGKSLEQIGVTPDEIVLPSPTDLATRRDPTLARAAEMAGVKIDPEKAGALFQ